MSDNTTDIEPDSQDDDGTDDGHLRDLRAAAERGKEAQRDAADARRELAFLKAGIDTDAGPGKLLFKSFDGEPTKDAVLAAAAEYGITPTTGQQTEPTGPDITPDERAQTRERSALVSGSDIPAGEGAPNPIDVGYAEFHKARAAGKPIDDAADHLLGRMFAAAAAGDPRVLFDQAAHIAESRR